MSTAKAFVASIALLLAAAAPASAGVVVNEVESQGGAVVDFVELINTGATAVDIGGWVIKDDDDNAVTVPAATSIAAGGYYVTDFGPGLGGNDSVTLFESADPTSLLDSYEWPAHAAATYGRCPNGTGMMMGTNSPTRGTANDCPAVPVVPLPWPGSSAFSIAGNYAFGSNLSGLSYQPSGSSAPGVLWAVRNGPSTLFRLIYDGTKWTPDTANGWSTGKTLRYANGLGVPDAEGVTLAGGDPNGVYVATERNDDPPADDFSLPAVLRYDVSSPAVTLSATREWDLLVDLPGLDENAGLEAVTWVPDDLLVSKGFRDEAKAKAYDPAEYPGHGTGLFFVGVEQDGNIVAYALNQTAGTFARVATIASGFPRVMALEYEPETTHLWAACDNTCDGRLATLDIAPAGSPNAGRFVVTNTYTRPSGLVSNLNNEGFAIAPQAECVGGLKPVFWSDDGNVGGTPLRTGKLNCTVPTPPTPTPTPTPGAQPGPPPPPPPPVDRTAPQLKVGLKFTKSGTHAVRRTGKFGVVITLGERADLTFTVTARKNAKARARTILRTARRGVAAGKPKLTLTLARKARVALRKGETVTLTVQARDAVGNTTTRRATAKVR